MISCKIDIVFCSRSYRRCIMSYGGETWPQQNWYGWGDGGWSQPRHAESDDRSSRDDDGWSQPCHADSDDWSQSGAWLQLPCAEPPAPPCAEPTAPHAWLKKLQCGLQAMDRSHRLNMKSFTTWKFGRKRRAFRLFLLHLGSMNVEVQFHKF